MLIRSSRLKLHSTVELYLLNAIGQETGNALIISESENSTRIRQDIDRMLNKSLNKVSISQFELENKEPEIEFQKIKLSYSIYAKFSINSCYEEFCAALFLRGLANRLYVGRRPTSHP
jgi:superfamily II DNA/RNA helicase